MPPGFRLVKKTVRIILCMCDCVKCGAARFRRLLLKAKAGLEFPGLPWLQYRAIRQIQSVDTAALGFYTQKTGIASAVVQNPVIEALRLIKQLLANARACPGSLVIPGYFQTTGGRAGAILPLPHIQRNISSGGYMVFSLFLAAFQRNLKPVGFREGGMQAKGKRHGHRACIFDLITAEKGAFLNMICHRDSKRKGVDLLPVFIMQLHSVRSHMVHGKGLPV